MNYLAPRLLLFGTTLLVALSVHAQNQGPPLENPKPDAAPSLERSSDNKDAADQSNAPEKRSRRYYRDRTFIGTDAVIQADEMVKDLVVVAANAEIEGTVRGDLVVIAGNVTLGTNAHVRGDLVIVGGTLDAPPEARIDGERVVVSPENAMIPNLHWLRPAVEWIVRIGTTARPLPYQYVWSWIIAGLFLLLYILAAILFPRSLQANVQVLETRPGASFLTGLLALMLAVPLIIFLVVSMVGVILVPVIVIGLVAAFFFGKIAVYCYAGKQLGSPTGLESLQKPLMALIIGVALFYALYMIPILGFIVWGALAPLALGAALLTFFSRFKRPPKPASALQVSTTPPSAAAPGAPALAVPPMLTETPATVPGAVPMRRVGFWYRFLATLIDAFIVGFALGILEVDGPAWLFIWVAYHIAMWTWLGATVGGLGLRLRVVRINGEPIDFATALVRAFSAFLSVPVLFVGFFWAGWTKERQSWHDRIAGTVIVKLAKGQSAISFPQSEPA